MHWKLKLFYIPTIESIHLSRENFFRFNCFRVTPVFLDISGKTIILVLRFPNFISNKISLIIQRWTRDYCYLHVTTRNIIVDNRWSCGDVDKHGACLASDFRI